MSPRRIPPSVSAALKAVAAAPSALTPPVPAEVGPATPPTSSTPPGIPHCWGLACAACGELAHPAPIFTLTPIEKATLARGIAPPSWKCKCLGGRPQQLIPMLAEIEIEIEKPRSEGPE